MTSSEQPRRGYGWILWVLLAVIIAVIAVMAISKPKPEEHAPPAEKAVPVVLMTMNERTITNRLVLPGHIEAFAEMDLAAEQPGRIIELPVDKGSQVKKGDLLMKIDDRLWKDTLERAQIEVREAEKDFKRWENLHKAGAVSVSDYDDVSTRNEQAAIALREAQTHLDKCTITAPVDGQIDDRYVELGEYATEGAPAFKLITIDPAKVSIDIPEQDIFAVRTGQKMTFRLPPLPDRVFTGTVTFVSSLARRESNAFRCEMTVDNPDGILRPGMIANVIFNRGLHENALVVPLASVIPDKGEHIIFVAQDGRAVRRTVKIDDIIDHEAVLSDGLKAGEKVVINGHRALADGSLLEIKKAKPAEEPAKSTEAAGHDG